MMTNTLYQVCSSNKPYDMASSSSSTPPAGAQPKIIEDIVDAGKKAFDPAAIQREEGVKEYNKLIERYVIIWISPYNFSFTEFVTRLTM